MIRILRAVAALAMAFIALSAYSQVCTLPPLAAGTTGIGDGCSTMNLEYVMPEIGAFKGTFTPACQHHDTCYTSLGTSYDECDSAFLSDMRSACKSSFNPFLDPTYVPCMGVAQEYYDGVRAYGATVNPLPNFQRDALNRSIALGNSVNSDSCGTTSTMIGLYGAALVAQVNAAFQSSAHRLPTIYEFLKVVNTGDLTTDRATWNNVTLPLQAAAAAGITPPTISVTFWEDYASMATLTVATTNAQSTLWKLNGVASTNPQWSLSWNAPKYDRTITEKGFVKVINSANVPNMTVIQQSISEPGICAPVIPGRAYLQSC